jgi:hypothetical protein
VHAASYNQHYQIKLIYKLFNLHIFQNNFQSDSIPNLFLSVSPMRSLNSLQFKGTLYKILSPEKLNTKIIYITIISINKVECVE